MRSLPDSFSSHTGVFLENGATAYLAEVGSSSPVARNCRRNEIYRNTSDSFVAFSLSFSGHFSHERVSQAGLGGAGRGWAGRGWAGWGQGQAGNVRPRDGLGISGSCQTVMPGSLVLNIA